RLGAGALAPLGAVHLRVVAVRPRPVIQEPIIAADAPAGHVSVAGGVVAVVVRAGGRQLVGGVVAVARRRAVHRLGGGAVGRVVGVGRLRQDGARLVLVGEARLPAGAVPGIRAGAHRGRARQVSGTG